MTQHWRSPQPDDHVSPLHSQDVEKIEPLQVKSGLHWMQWVTYIIVCLFCIFITYVVVTGLMALNDFATQLQGLLAQWRA